jgi:endonuclease YncB( thermonuclease family)
VDRYGRSVAEVIGNKGMVNLAMVRSGQAFLSCHLDA